MKKKINIVLDIILTTACILTAIATLILSIVFFNNDEDLFVMVGIQFNYINTFIIMMFLAFLSFPRKETDSKEQEKILKIIKEKEVNVRFLKYSKNLKDYNDVVSDHLTQEEFDLLKEFFK